jgi:hypothetical protein
LFTESEGIVEVLLAIIAKLLLLLSVLLGVSCGSGLKESDGLGELEITLRTEGAGSFGMSAGIDDVALCSGFKFGYKVEVLLGLFISGDRSVRRAEIIVGSCLTTLIVGCPSLKVEKEKN